MFRFCVLSLLLCVAAPAFGQFENVTDSDYPNLLNVTSQQPSLSDAVQMQQQMSQVYTHLTLELTSALAWYGFSNSMFSLAVLEQHPGATQNMFGLEEEDSDDEAADGADFEERLGAGPRTGAAGNFGVFTPALTTTSPYANAMYGANAYGANAYGANAAYAANPYYAQANPLAAMYPAAQTPQQPHVDKEKLSAELENAAEFQLTTLLKIMQIENTLKLHLAQNSFQQNTLASLMLGSSEYLSNPIAVQMLYLLKYKMFLDTFGSAYSIVRQDAWTQWNYMEILETKEFNNGRTTTDSFTQALVNMKNNAMHAYFHEAQIDLLTLYIDHYLTAVVSGMGSMGSGGSSSFPGSSMPGSSFPGSSVPQYPQQQGQYAFLEEEVEAKPGLPSPQTVLTYTNYMRLLTRVVNYITAQSYAMESELEFFLSSPTNSDPKARESATNMLSFVHTQAIYSLRGYGYLRLTLASLDITVFGLAGGFQGSFAGSMGSLASSLGSFSSMGPSFGSLAPAAGSLGVAALAGMGAQGSLALSALAGPSFGGSLASRSAMHTLHNLIQEDVSTAAPTEDSAASAQDPVAEVEQIAAAAVQNVDVIQAPAQESASVSPVVGQVNAPVQNTAAFPATASEYNLVG